MCRFTRVLTITVGVLVLLGNVALAEESASSAGKRKTANQVFFRGAYSRLMENSRGNEVFTDTLGATNFNSNRDGFSVGAGLDLGMMDMEEMMGTRVIGEVFAEYTRFSQATVTQATSALLGTPTERPVSVSELNVTIAPKVMFNSAGHVRPYIIPVGISFLVNSPPSDDTSYLDLGLHFAGGVDFKLIEGVSLGADIRYTHGFEHSNTSTRYLSPGGYLAVNF